MSELQLLWDMGLVITAATILAYATKLIRQPHILAYILAGIIIGPLGLKLITNSEVIRTLSELGIAFLLFIVGLELDLRRLRDIGLAATTIAIVKSLLLFGLTIIFLSSFNIVGLDTIGLLYVGTALSFISTMIVVKLLSDKDELDTLHGRIILGILLMEDLIAILSLSVLSTIGDISFSSIGLSMINGLGLFSIAIVISRFVVPTLFRLVSDSHELMFLTALTIFFVFTKLSELVGFPVAIGAFIAGVSIATFPYNLEIVGKVRSLRDFFAIIFFVSLGMEITVGSVNGILLTALALTALVVLIKPVIIMSLTSLFGYRRRVSFLTGISLIQISEFSLIILSQGLIAGHISNEMFSIIALTATISFTLTAYAIKFNSGIYQSLSRYLVMFDKLSGKKGEELEDIPKHLKNHVVVCGCHRMGYNIIKKLQRMGKQYIVIEYNPERTKTLLKEGVPCTYGDLLDVDVLNKLCLDKADVIVSTVVNDDDSMLLIEQAKKVNPKSFVIVTTDTVPKALELYRLGADYVIVPKILSGIYASDVIEEYVKKPDRLKALRDKHIVDLERIQQEETLGKYEMSLLLHIEDKKHGEEYRK
ncbi:MAG: cation:proton antiporter [Candidatus Altiarchaeota archaeon]|nr:cation:proton antiporter [Candidatus Altiarchaeota archaeon]